MNVSSYNQFIGVFFLIVFRDHACYINASSSGREDGGVSGGQGATQDQASERVVDPHFRVFGDMALDHLARIEDRGIETDVRLEVAINGQVIACAPLASVSNALYSPPMISGR